MQLLIMKVTLWTPRLTLSDNLTPETNSDIKNVPRPALKQISVLESGLNSLIYTNALVSSIYSSLGGVECTGIDGNTGLPLISPLSSFFLGEALDFSGSSLCKLSCAGTCVPYPDKSPAVGPASLYPFGCECSAGGCNADGPIPVRMKI